MVKGPLHYFSFSLVLLTLFISSCVYEVDLNVDNMLVEYEKNPLGIDVEKPRLSWIINSEQRGVSQSAYRILLADNQESLARNTGNLWDTEIVSSSQSVNIEYNGDRLASGTTYYWKVQVWNQDDESVWSEVNSFHTGMMSPSDWEANWISVDDPEIAAPYLRRVFDIEKPIQSAFVYATGVGYYELYLNGEKVGNHLLDPATTDFTKRVLYATYDVTDYLKVGNNAAGFLLGNGAYRMERIAGRYAWGGANRFGPLKAIMQLDITYTDGTTDRVMTDGSWVSSASPITYNNIFGGEDYDARLEQPGWATTRFDDTNWDLVSVVEGPGGIMDAQLMPAITVRQAIRPVAETQPEEGVFLFDMGQNFPGWWRIEVEGEAGLTLRIRGSETLNDSAFPTRLQTDDVLSTNKNYHKQVWTDYTLKGGSTEGEVEVYEPRFFYTGYRYVEVTASDPIALKSLKVEGRVVNSSLKRNGYFITSNDLLNKIHEATVWSQIGNTHGYPTDCPHREKGGYNGDGQVVAEAAMHDFHMQSFYAKWLNDMKDAQEDNGRIPNTSPTLLGGFGGGIAWGSAYILLPYWMHHYYDDKRIIEEHYPTMQRYLEYLENLAQTDTVPEETHIINAFGNSPWLWLGEWSDPSGINDTNRPVVNTYFYYLSARRMSEIAQILERYSDADYYAALADTVKAAFNEKFLNLQTNLYGVDTIYQSYQALALAGKAAPDHLRGAILETLVNDIENEKEGHLDTGILGTKALWKVLAHEGRSDLAYTIATKTTFPSYGYWIENGATTLWERWSGQHSHNHQMFGSIDEFFYKYLAGIHSPTDGTTSKGYKHITIQPYVPADLEWVEASIETMAGEVSSYWQNNANEFRLQVTIPANSTATIKIPTLGQSNAEITEDGLSITTDTKDITYLGIEGDYAVLNVKSGTYRFVSSSMDGL